MNRYQMKAALYIILLLILAGPDADASDDLFSRMKAGGHILMLRHAYAPGSGDPQNFKLGDCATQRNLDAQGRSQARRLGARLRKHGIRSARVFSSQWCRCHETAKLLDLGPVVELPALNSFFERPADREPNMKNLRTFLSNQSREGELIVLVTHFVTISALTDEGVSSGEGVVLELKPKGNVQKMGRLEFDD